MLKIQILALSIFLLTLPCLAVQKATPNRRPIIKTGSLKIKVGVIMGSGDIKYLPKVPFYLTSKSLQEIQISLIDNKLPPSLDEWLATKNASFELISLTKKLTSNWIDNLKSSNRVVERTELDILEKGLKSNSYEFVEQHPEIPEFQQILLMLEEDYKNCLSDPTNFMCKSTRERQYKSYSIEAVTNKSTFNYLKSNNSYQQYFQQWWFNINKVAKDQVKKYIITSCTTNFDAICTMDNIKIGKYFLTNLYPSKAGRSLILWDTKTSIKPGYNYIELSNDNDSLLKNYATNEYEYSAP